MRALIARDLADASLACLSADRRFAAACNDPIPRTGYGHIRSLEQGRTPSGVLGEHEIGIG